MKVAIICDWLLGTGGAERVVLELHKMYPNAPIYTSQYNPDPKIWYGDKWFEDADIRTGWLQKLPRSLKKFLPVFRAWYFSRLDLSDYDLVISSSGAEAKFVKVKAGAVHVSYCHAPTHYYWARYEEYLEYPGFGWLDPLARIGLKILGGPMRRWDKKAAQRPNHIVANSKFTQSQIEKYYGRKSTVVHPPVDVERFFGSVKPDGDRHGFIIAGRQTPYKKIDLAIEAASEADFSLIVIGNGPDHGKLKRLAGRKVTFLSDVKDEEMPDKLGSARVFIFPGIDDFGIVAIEALAAGTPVLAYGEGGQRDYISSENGGFFDEQKPEVLAQAMKTIRGKKFNHARIAATASRFSATQFKINFQELVKSYYK